MLYKTIHGQAACVIQPHFPYCGFSYSHTRRSLEHQFSLPTQCIDTYKYSFYPRTIRIWNILPNSSVSAPDKDDFKVFLEQPFSSGAMYVSPNRSQYHQPWLGSSGYSSAVGPSLLKELETCTQACRDILDFLRIQALDYPFQLYWMCGLIWVSSYFLDSFSVYIRASHLHPAPE